MPSIRQIWRSFSGDSQVEQLREELRVALDELRAAREIIRIQQARIQELEEKLGINSDNSSKPPSSDPPSHPRKKKKARRRGKKRKPGGQVGHEGKSRKLLPKEDVDHFYDCKPASMCSCGGNIKLDERDPERKQKFEIPKIVPEVLEYKIYGGVCDCCGQHHRGTLPEGTPEGILMPRAMGIVGISSGKYHLSKRSIEGILKDFFGLVISLGTVSNTEARVSKALAKPVDQAKEYIQEQEIVHSDETGHKVAGKKAWMWAAATSLVCVFLIRTSRATKVAKELLGETFKGILVSDRWNAYNWIDAVRRQLCWAHLIRDFTKISDRSGRSGEIGDELLYLIKRKIFHYWHWVRDGLITRKQFQSLIAPVRLRVETLIEEGITCGHANTERTCKRILKLKAALWTFVDFEGVEPTNNFMERLIRPFVLWRKNSFGTQSERGNLFVERMMTVSTTCKLQERDVLDYVTKAIEAHLRGNIIPSLLPRNGPCELGLAA